MNLAAFAKSKLVQPMKEIAKTIVRPPRPAPRGDPFYSNDEHVREVNARATPQGGGWLTPRPGWLTRYRGRW